MKKKNRHWRFFFSGTIYYFNAQTPQDQIYNIGSLEMDSILNKAMDMIWSNHWL